MAGKKRGNAKASRKRQSSERSGLIEEVSTSSDKSGETRSDSDSESCISKQEMTPTRSRIFTYKDSVTNCLVTTDPNFQAIHDAFLIQLLLILCFTLVKDSYNAGRLYLNVTLFSVGFGSLTDIGIFALVEICLQVWAFAVYPILKVWERHRSFFPLLFDVFFLLLYILHIVISFASMISAVCLISLPHIVNFIIGIEQFRLFMKSYSFVRENAYKVLYPWHKDDTSGPAVWYAGQMSPTVGSFSQYFYFLFCPTLLYRDHYPRNDRVNFRVVLVSFIQFLLALWSTVFIMTNILYPRSMRQEDLLHTLMMSLVMALVIMIIAHTAILNAYLNMSAELVRFADRQFFSDWWACTTYSSYYRKWNLLVHDWIHSYVYLDLKKFTGKRFAVFLTILVSSIVHEYLLSMGVAFVFPVVTFLFAGVGGFFYVLKPLSTRRASNLIFLFSLNLGFTIILFFLITEFAARNYCPVQKNTWSTMVTPQLFSCYAKHNPLTPRNFTSSLYSQI